MEREKQKKEEITKMQQIIRCALLVEDDGICRKLLEKHLSELGIKLKQ